MDINQMFGALQQFASQIASSYCVVNGAFMGLNEIANMGYEEFSLKSKLNMLMKQYKYFSNKDEEAYGKQVAEDELHRLKELLQVASEIVGGISYE